MNINMYAGDSLLLDVAVKNIDGTPRDITGGTLAFNVYVAPHRTAITPEFTGDTTIVSAEDGTGTASFDSLHTVDFPDFRVLYYMITLTETGGEVTVIQDGKLTVR